MFKAGSLLYAALAMLAADEGGTAGAGPVDPFAGLADPTRPLIEAAPPAPEEDEAPGLAQSLLDRLNGFELTSVLIRPGLRLAVINSERVAIGDRVGSARVAAIEPGLVVLEMNGERRELRLHRGSIKTPAEAARSDNR